MKATISELWETGREIVTFDNSDVDRPCSISDLKKCDNVLVDGRIDGPKSPFEVIIDDSIFLVEQTTVRHPCGGNMRILELY